MKVQGDVRPMIVSGAQRLREAMHHRSNDKPFPGPELGARCSLLIFGVAALTASRTASFVGQAPSDRHEPGFPPLLWLFHLADALFLPWANHLPGLTAVAYLQFFTLAVSLVCFFLAVRSTIPAVLKRHHRPLITAGIPLAGLLVLLSVQGTLPYAQVLGTPTHYGNDAISVTSCATDAFLRGENPYSQFRVVPCLSKFFDPKQVAIKTTPLQAGSFASITRYPTPQQLTRQFRQDQRRNVACPEEFECSYSYPAASFILPAAFVALHLQDLSVFFAVCYVAIALLVIWHSSGWARWAALLIVAADAALWPTIDAGATDGLYALLVALAWTWRDRRWVSVVLLGLAVASRQQAWFYLLFYAILIARTMGRKELILRLSVVIGVFAALNLPYFVASPGPWLSGVLGPMRDPMFPRGTGAIALSIYGKGSLPLGPRGLYTLLELISLGGCLVYYWKVCRRHPWLGLVLAPLPLFFAWRSLYSYFLPLSLLVLYPALVQYGEPSEPATVPLPRDASAADESAIVAA